MQQQYIKPGSPHHLRIITASKVGIILGVSDFQSPAQLWLTMTGRIDPEPADDAMLRGSIQEASILEWFYTVEHPELTRLAGETTWINPNYDWCAANTDSHARAEDEEIIFVEAKSIARDKGTWGTPGTDEIPEAYWAQVQFQMWVADHLDGPGVTRCYVIKHGPYVDQYDTYEVHYQPRAAQKIADQCKAFYDSLSDPDGCPPAAVHKGEHRWFAKVHPDINRDQHWDINRDLAEAYVLAREQQALAIAKVDKAKADILRAMGNARTAEYCGLTIAYRRPTKTGVSLYPPQRDITVTDLNHAESAATDTAA